MKIKKSIKSFKALSENSKAKIKGGQGFRYNTGGRCRFCPADNGDK